jgi:transcriptional regulator with XRE-family HTH domain
MAALLCACGVVYARRSWVLEVKQLRLARKWNQTELAYHAGLAPSVISEIENGKRDPSARTLRKLAEAFGVDVADLFPKDLSPRLPLEERGERPPEEFEQALARVLEPVRAEALREQQAANRTISSEGLDDARHIGDPPEVEAGSRFLDEFSPDERPLAFGELAIGYARHERANANLEANYTNAQGLLRERDEKIARLEEENAHLREEHEQTKVEKP